jgi:hypothetical protein
MFFGVVNDRHSLHSIVLMVRDAGGSISSRDTGGSSLSEVHACVGEMLFDKKGAVFSVAWLYQTH